MIEIFPKLPLTLLLYNRFKKIQEIINETPTLPHFP